MERETLGPAGKRLSEAATNAGAVACASPKFDPHVAAIGPAQLAQPAQKRADAGHQLELRWLFYGQAVRGGAPQNPVVETPVAKMTSGASATNSGAYLRISSGLPVYYELSFVIAGGLISYGPDVVEEYRQAAGYVDRAS
jgi:hypothetical protein